MLSTNLKVSMNEYIRLVVEDSKRAENSLVYGNLLKNLSTLTEMTQKYYTTDKDGKEKPLLSNDYKELINAYSELAKSCNEFLSDDHSKNRLENRRVRMMKRLSSDVGKDLRGLMQADKTKESTLSDVVKESRIKVVDLSGKNLGRAAGGALSNRIPLKSASGIEGFFTEKVTYEYGKPFKNIKNSIIEELPEIFLEGFNDDSKRKDFFENLMIYPDVDIYSEDERVREQSFKKLAMVLSSLNQEVGILNIIPILKENPKFAKNLQKNQKKYFSIGASKMISDIAGISENSRLDQRNSAMSDVAEFLGMSKIIAKATPMKIIRDDQVIEGTFMEKAIGEDIDKLSKESLALQADKDSFNHPTGLKQIADLQVLDYICGNVDRHSANIMYQFKKNDDGKVVLTGICGIDNDASFGTRLFKAERDGKEITPLVSIKNISTSCLEALETLSLNALKVTLADKLKKKEIDAVCKRIELVREKVLAKEINVIKDELWGKDVTYDKLSGGYGGITKTIESAIRTISNAHVYPVPEKISSIDYAEGKEVTNETEFKFKESFSKVERFVSKAGELRWALHKDSAEYKAMLKALKDVQDLGKSIKKDLNTNKNVDLDMLKKFDKKVADLGIASQNYMNAKNLSQRTEHGRDRFALATEMRDFGQENIVMQEKAEIKEQEPQVVL